MSIGPEPAATGPRGALALLLAVMSPALAARNSPAPSTASSHALARRAIRLAARESEQLQIARAGVDARRRPGARRRAASTCRSSTRASSTRARCARSSRRSPRGSRHARRRRAPQTAVALRADDSRQRHAGRARRRTRAGPTCPARQGHRLQPGRLRRAQLSTRSASPSRRTSSRAAASVARTPPPTAQQRVAEVELTSQRAQLALDVTQAYFDAVLADRLVTIADTALAQTEELLRQTTVARQVGNQSEFELLRATVTRDNQRPVVIPRRGDRDIAYFRLKQLLNLPLDEPLQLTTPIDQPAAITRDHRRQRTARRRNARSSRRHDTLRRSRSRHGHDDRAPVRESGRSGARAGRTAQGRARRPLAVARRSRRNYQRLFFPRSFLPSLNQYSENWTIGGSLSLPLFTGGRVSGQIEVAQANLDEARARLQQSQGARGTRHARRAQPARSRRKPRSPRAAARRSRRSAPTASTRSATAKGSRPRRTSPSRACCSSRRRRIRRSSARDLAVARARIALLRDLPDQHQRARRRGPARSTQQQQQQQQQQHSSSSTPQSAAAGSHWRGTNREPHAMIADQTCRARAAHRWRVLALAAIGLSVPACKKNDADARAREGRDDARRPGERDGRAGGADPHRAGHLRLAHAGAVGDDPRRDVAAPWCRRTRKRASACVRASRSRRSTRPCCATRRCRRARRSRRRRAATTSRSASSQRNETLEKAGAIAERDVERARNALLAAQAQLANARAQLANVQKQLDKASVQAPFDGVVVAAPGERG